MGEITGGVYRGSDPDRVRGGKWTCPSCGTEHLTKFELGCPSCGAGTPAQLEAAQVEAKARRALPMERLVEAVLAERTDNLSEDGVELALGHLTRHARLSVAVALAHYADHGSAPSTEELPRIVAQAWARHIYTTVTAEADAEAARKLTPPTESR